MKTRTLALLGLLLGTMHEPLAATSLLPIPQLHLERVEHAVAERIRHAQGEFASISKDPNATVEALGDAYGELGRLYHAHRLDESAEACYRNAQRLMPEDFRWHYLLGYLGQQSGQLEMAAESYERARTIERNYPALPLRLGQVYLGLNQPETAEPLLRGALASEGLQGAAAFELGKAALAREDFGPAVKWFKQALESQPGASRVRYPLAMAYRGMGDVEQARAHISQRGDVDPEIPDLLVSELDHLLSGVRTRLYYAMKAVWAKQFDVAAKAFREIVRLEPENLRARVSLARSLYLIGQRDDAQAQLRIALELKPDDVQANYFMGRFLEEMGSADKAVAQYRATLASDPQHGGAHFFLADALMREGDFKAAAAHYARVVALVPEDLEPRQMEALALIATRARDKEALDRLEAGLDVYPADPLMTRALARLLASSPVDEVRDGARAANLANELFKQVNSIENAETVAMAYAELGRYKDAIAFQQAAINAAVQFGGLELLPRLNANLDRYKERKPCRVPWQADDPLFYPSPVAGTG